MDEVKWNGNSGELSGYENMTNPADKWTTWEVIYAAGVASG